MGQIWRQQIDYEGVKVQHYDSEAVSSVVDKVGKCSNVQVPENDTEGGI